MNRAKFDKSLRASCLLGIVYILILCCLLFFSEKSRSGSVAGTCGVVQLQKGALRLSPLLPCCFGYDFDVFGKTCDIL